MRRFAWVLVLAGSAGLVACTAPIAGGLDEDEANRVVLALDRAGLDATKESDPIAEGKFRVVVQRDDASRALATLSEEELPRPRAKGVLESLDKGALVPSPAAEHAQIVRGLSGELERTLGAVDGVLVARVHLSLPEKDPLRPPEKPQKATASVLLEHRGSTSPMTQDAVQRLVAGAAPGLAPSDVAVVILPRVRPAGGPREPGITHVGPIAVVRTSARPLQALLAGLVAVVGLLAAAALLLYMRLGRARRDAAPIQEQRRA